MKKLKLNSLNKIKNNKGFILIELMAGLGIISVITIQGVKMLDEYNKTRIARNVGEHIRSVGQAANKYVTEFYDEINLKSKQLTVGITKEEKEKIDNLNNAEIFKTLKCTGNAMERDCSISIQELKNLGFLNKNTNYDKSPVGLDYLIRFKVKEENFGGGTVPIINGLVLTKTPWFQRGQQVNYALLGEATHQAGIDAGFTSVGQTDKMRGYKSAWELNNHEFPAINASGLLGYRFGFHAGDMMAFLRRDGSLPMTGNLKLGGNELYFGFGDQDGGIKREGDNIRITAGYDTNPDGTKNNKAGILITPEEIVGDKWLCAQNEKPSKICLGGDQKEGIGANFELKMYDNRPLYIHNFDTKADGSTIDATGNDKVVLRVGGSASIHDNLYVGDKDTNTAGNDANGIPLNNQNISNLSGKIGGNIVSNYNINYGTAILDQNADNPTVLNDYNDTNRYLKDSPIAIELNRDGSIIAKDIFLKDIGSGENEDDFKNADRNNIGSGVHISQALPSYSSRGAFVVHDGDIIQKPKCEWTKDGQTYGRTGKPKIILSVGNIHTSGDEVDQNDTTTNGAVPGEKHLRKHRILLKAEDLDANSNNPDINREAADNNWKVVIKTRSFDGSKWVSAGQAVAHIYCQLY